MLKFAANLSLLWAELPYLDRFAAAADAGFEAVEILFPYDLAASRTQRALIANGLELILMNGPPPNYTGGARGFAAVPGGEERFKYDMRRAFRYVDVLKPKFLHVMAGEAEGESAKDTIIRNLKWASEAAPKGLTLTVEPLNPKAMPGYFLNDYVQAADILDAVAALPMFRLAIPLTGARRAAVRLILSPSLPVLPHRITKAGSAPNTCPVPAPRRPLIG